MHAFSILAHWKMSLKIGIIRRLFHWQTLTKTRAWKSKHAHYIVWDLIINFCLTFNGILIKRVKIFTDLCPIRNAGLDNRLSHYHIFPWLCAWDVCYILFCHLLHIRSGKTGNLLSLLFCSLWWVQIFGYVLACRSYSFVCTVHLLIITIVQIHLKALNL